MTEKLTLRSATAHTLISFFFTESGDNKHIWHVMMPQSSETWCDHQQLPLKGSIQTEEKTKLNTNPNFGLGGMISLSQHKMSVVRGIAILCISLFIIYSTIDTSEWWNEAEYISVIYYENKLTLCGTRAYWHTAKKWAQNAASITNFVIKGIVHFEIIFRYVLAYLKGIQDGGVFDSISIFLGQTVLVYQSYNAGLWSPPQKACTEKSKLSMI